MKDFDMLYNKNKQLIYEIKDIIINIREIVENNINKLNEMRNE